MNHSPPVSPTEVRELISAISRLSLALETYNSSVLSAPAASSGTPAEVATVSDGSEHWILVEESELLPTGYRGEESSRIVEEGPPSCPPALYSLGQHRLTSVHPGSDRRVRRAFVAGFWAWAAQATNTDYSAAESIGLADCHFVILRSWSADPREITLPVRVDRKCEVQKICGRDPLKSGSIVQGFASLTEVQCFCSGAGIEVPPLYQWRPSKQV